MTIPELQLTDLDQRIWEEELNEFVPARVFDAHTHIFRWSHYLDPQKHKSGHGQLAGTSYEEATFALLDECDATLFPGREVHRLAFPFPWPQVDFDETNRFIAGQVAQDPASAALMLVHPKMPAEEVEQTILKYGFLGLKPYRYYSVTGDPDQCRITDFMAEHQIAVADRLGLIIMMHVSKRNAIADPDNMRDMVELSARYPRVKWILAHCARSYSAWAIEKAAPVLRDLPNIWYDTSSVCESDSFDALYSGVGIERVMYGSDDIPVGVGRGKYITWGFAWTSLSPQNQPTALTHCDWRMTFVRYEELRGMRRAARRYGATPAQIQDLFAGTAERLIASARGN